MTYLWAGYAITWLAVVWFAWHLERRAGRVGRHLRAVQHGAGDETAAPRREPVESEQDA